MKILRALIPLLFSGLAVCAAETEFPLWPEAAPGALGKEAEDIPTLTTYLPENGKATGAAIVIFPGGGYGGLAPHEGDGYARWFSDQGVTAFVLKYRLGPRGYRHPIMLQDAARAVRYVRAKAADWKIDSNKVGIIGSSAGGHLASTLLTHFDSGKTDDKDPIERQSSRPDIGILCYPVISMGPISHAGSRQNLLGKEASEELVQMLSNERQVTKETPPCFIWHTWEDKAVKVENSLEFAAALQKSGVPFDLHIYEKGAHGLGLGSREYDPQKFHPWVKDCLFWLKQRGWVK